MRDIVISLCDYTGNMVKPWMEGGYDCLCVDTQHSIRNDNRLDHSSGGSTTYVWGDARSWLPPIGRRIAALFAFPPCTDLAVSGARDFEKKGGYRLSDALELYDSCMLAARYSGARFMLENPIGRLSTARGKPQHSFDPCDYAGYLLEDKERQAEAYTKRTCLWTGGGFVMPPKLPVEPLLGSKMHYVPPGEQRQNIRSATPMGFAYAVYLHNSQNT